MDQQVVHECRRDRLPSRRLAFLVQEDEALCSVEVGGSELECSASAAGCFGVEPQQKGVEFGIVSGGCGYFDDLCQSMVWDGAAGAGESSGFWYA
jgi:hypothetical protein